MVTDDRPGEAEDFSKGQVEKSAAGNLAVLPGFEKADL